MKTPTNNDNIVSLVINANEIATIGGNNVNIPNFAAGLSVAGAWVIIQKELLLKRQLLFQFSYYYLCS